MTRAEHPSPPTPHLTVVPRNGNPAPRILPFPPSASEPAGSRPGTRRADPPPPDDPLPPPTA